MFSSNKRYSLIDSQPVPVALFPHRAASGIFTNKKYKPVQSSFLRGTTQQAWEVALSTCVCQKIRGWSDGNTRRNLTIITCNGRQGSHLETTWRHRPSRRSSGACSQQLLCKWRPRMSPVASEVTQPQWPSDTFLHTLSSWAHMGYINTHTHTLKHLNTQSQTHK